MIRPTSSAGTRRQGDRGHVRSGARQLDGVARSGLIFVEVFDGDRTGSGTLEFNVVQNGQPRWLPLPAVSLTEDGQTSFNLLNYLRDTDIDGNEVSASNLAVQVRNISDETLVRATIRDGHFLDIETVDDDVYGCWS